MAYPLSRKITRESARLLENWCWQVVDTSDGAIHALTLAAHWWTTKALQGERGDGGNWLPGVFLHKLKSQKASEAAAEAAATVRSLQLRLLRPVFALTPI